MFPGNPGLPVAELRKKLGSNIYGSGLGVSSWSSPGDRVRVAPACQELSLERALLAFQPIFHTMHSITQRVIMQSQHLKQLIRRIGSQKPDHAGKKRDVSAIGAALGTLLEKLGGEQNQQISQLWRNWSMVMGEDLAQLALPLGSRGPILLVGAEDNMAMSELTYAIAEILERVNAFMDSDYFTKVELHLVMGKNTLDTLPAITTLRPRAIPQAPPGLTGIHLQAQGGKPPLFDPESPVAKCYQAYLNVFASKIR